MNRRSPRRVLNSCSCIISIIDLDPNWWGGHHWLGLVYLEARRPSEAIPELEKAAQLSGRASWPLAFLANSYAQTDRRPESDALIKELEARYPKGESIAVQMAAAYMGRGDKDAAFTWLDKALADRSGELIRIRTFPPFTAIRDDPRYKSLLKSMNLPE